MGAMLVQEHLVERQGPDRLTGQEPSKAPAGAYVSGRVKAATYLMVSVQEEGET